MTIVQTEPNIDRIKVRSVYDMPDDIFIKHLLTRHQNDFKNWNLEKIRHFAKGWSNPWRAFHENLHKNEIPGQYDHYHLRKR